MWTSLLEFLDTPLFSLGGAILTPGGILTVLAVVAVGRLVARLAGRAVERVIAARGGEFGVQFAVGKVVRYALSGVVLLVAVASLGIDIDALLAASAVLLVGLGFGLQKVAENFISGLVLLIERPVKRGDFVRIGETCGTVADIGLRATKVVTRNEVTIIVPNSQLVTTEVVNHSVPTLSMRVSVSVGVAYGSDVRAVKDALVAVAAASPNVLADPPPEVRLDQFGDSALQMSLLVWIANPRHDERVASELRFAIDDAFRVGGIVIPFPQRDLHVRSVS